MLDIDVRRATRHRVQKNHSRTIATWYAWVLTSKMKVIRIWQTWCWCLDTVHHSTVHASMHTIFVTMYIHVYIDICIHMCVYIYINTTYLFTNLYVYIYMYTWMCLCERITSPMIPMNLFFRCSATRCHVPQNAMATLHESRAFESVRSPERGTAGTPWATSHDFDLEPRCISMCAFGPCFTYMFAGACIHLRCACSIPLFNIFGR